MSLIGIADLSFGYGGGEEIFSHLSLNLSDDWRLGLIGRNGRGKTTLLKILAGELEYRGRISAQARMVYFPFELDGQGGGMGQAGGMGLGSAREASPQDGNELSSLEVLGRAFPGLGEWNLLREAALLALNEDCLKRPLATLSPGEVTKLKLAALFAMEGVFPLLDEPSGGLDERGRRLAAGYLAKKKGFIVVSHDRFLLNRAIDHVLALGRNGPELFKGDFDSYWRTYEQRGQSEAERAQTLGKEVKRLKAAARRSMGWSHNAEKVKYGHGMFDKGAIGHKAAKMAKRAKSVAARRDKALDEKSQIAWTTERNPALGLKPLEHGPGRLIDGRDLVLGYGNEAIIRGLDLTLEAGERLAVKGPNGCGKSLLVSVLTGGAGRVLSGRLTLAPRLVVSGLAQRNYLEKGTVRDFCQKNGSSETLVKTLLNYLGFGKGDLEKNLENLSDGQKRKAHLALALAQSAHLYVWDEPLNFLDLFSRTQLEDLILKDRPTMVFVEHDLTFMEKVATRELDLTPFSREFFDKSR